MDNSVYSIGIVVAVLVIWRRTRGMYRPIRGNGYRMLLPLLFLLPSFSLITNPNAHASNWEWWTAGAIGCLMSLPLIWTTNFERRADQQIYAVKNIGFFLFFLAILAIRFLLRDYLSAMDSETMAALIMTLLMGYVLPWRIVSFLKFRRVYLDQPLHIEKV